MAAARRPVDRQKLWFQIITTPTADTLGTSLFLHFDDQRYLFGQIAEGTQRACIQRGVALKKIHNFFLTGQIKSATNGGMLGMILTLADVQGQDEETGKRRRLHIHGGPKLNHALACGRRFIFRTGMPITTHEKAAQPGRASTDPDYTDEHVNVWALPVQKSRSRSSSPASPKGRSKSPGTVGREQRLREKTVNDMFDSDWRMDKLVESEFKDVTLPAMVWVRSSEAKGLQATFCTKPEDAPHISPNQTVFVRTPWPAALISELPPADNLPSSVSISYVVKGHAQRGVFDPHKAKAMGIPPGPVYRVLAQGESLTLENGTTVKPEDVLSPPEPGQGMAILDVPSQDYLEDLLSRLSELKEDGVLEGVRVANWILGPGVFGTSEFKASLGHFPEFKHIISSPDTGPNYLSMDSSAASSIRLSLIRPECFLRPTYSSTILQDNVAVNSYDVEMAQRGTIIQLFPKFLVNLEEVPEDINVNAIANTAYSNIRDSLPSVETAPTHKDEKYGDIEITTLGTGSAVPSKYRNVSANLVMIPGLGHYLFDAGENTMGQLRRIYSAEQLEEMLCDLRMIWISHLHADHHLGTMPILQARKEAVKKRRASGQEVKNTIYLISEKNMPDYVNDYSSVEAVECFMLSCHNSQLMDMNGKPVNIQDTSLPIKELLTTRVSHCHGAQAIAVTFSNGFKLSYSGDCRPSGKFAEIGSSSDVLIHEATFDDGLEGDAMAKKHCTIGEALGVAMAMKAKNVILTHFSQRYQKLPVLTNIKFPGQLKFEESEEDHDPAGPLEEADILNTESTIEGDIRSTPQVATTDKIDAGGSVSNHQESSSSLLQKVAADMNICVAFDLMRVRLSQIADMHKYYPAIERMFETQQQKSDERREVNRAISDPNARNKPRKRPKDIYEAINRPQGGGKTPLSRSTSGRRTPQQQIADQNAAAAAATSSGARPPPTHSSRAGANNTSASAAHPADIVTDAVTQAEPPRTPTSPTTSSSSAMPTPANTSDQLTSKNARRRLERAQRRAREKAEKDARLPQPQQHAVAPLGGPGSMQYRSDEEQQHTDGAVRRRHPPWKRIKLDQDEGDR